MSLSEEEKWQIFLNWLRDNNKKLYVELMDKEPEYPHAIIVDDYIDVFGKTWGVYLPEHGIDFIFNGDGFDETRDVYYSKEEWDPDEPVNLFWLETGEPVVGYVTPWVFDALREGSRFTIYAKTEELYFTLGGKFTRKFVSLSLPWDISEDEADIIFNWCDDNLGEIFSILRSYKPVREDLYRVSYQAPNREKKWKKVIRGWIAVGAPTGDVEKIEKICWEAPFSALVVIPKQSNVAVAYFDVWVEKENVETFKELLRRHGIEDKFDYSEGINIEIL